MGRKPTKNLNLPEGMRARRQKSGTIYYYFDLGGKPRREMPLGNDYALAVKRWSELQIDSRPRHVEIITFKYVADRYLRDIIPTKAAKTQRDNIRCMATLLKFFNDPPAPLEVIAPINIRQYLDWRKASPVAANREKALFSHIWNCAREWGYTEKANPCAGVKGYKEAGRDIYIEDGIYRAVYDAADQPLKDALDLAYLTGQRPADALRMAETDIKDGAIWLRQGKTGKKLRIAIIGELQVLLERIKVRKAAHKVRAVAIIVNEDGKPLTSGALRYRFDHARERAIETNPTLADDIQKFQFRDLRAKAGTDKAESSGDIRQAQKQLGHGSVTMTEHYIRDRKGDLAKPTK